MLAKKFRFHGHGSLRYVYRNGEAVRSRLFTVKFTRNPRRQVSRYAVVVSKKVHKSAVGRNRMRRRVYEILREFDKHTDRAYDIVIIIANAEVIHMSASELGENLGKQLKQIS